VSIYISCRLPHEHWTERAQYRAGGAGHTPATV